MTETASWHVMDGIAILTFDNMPVIASKLGARKVILRLPSRIGCVAVESFFDLS